MINTECGIFSIISKEKISSNTCINGLKKLQHRGRESFGISYINKNTINVVKKIGLVTSVLELDNVKSNCWLGQITTAINGTVVAGKVTCLEVPGGSDPDIDLWYADNAAGVEDAATSTLTNQVQLTNGGDHTLGDTDSFIVDVVLPADKYLYLGCGGGENATYTKGKLLIELIGTI